ncbi:hypothetical protein AX15_001384 [Amanita polypyramis BW_CC]|nr:hypothetical protein AX15_001384 [Amanita polypyramis BW_CC]
MSTKRTPQLKISLNFRKSEASPVSEPSSARSSIVSSVSTLVAKFNDDRKSRRASKIDIREEDLIDWEDQAWGSPKTTLSWSGLFGRRKD